jgi:transcriptional regulator with XRE-family HTH domain
MTELPQAGVVPEWTLGWRMQRALAHAEISVEAIAGELGVSRSSVSRWLNDRGAPPRAAYVKLWALRTGVPFDWLAGDQFPRRVASKSALILMFATRAFPLTVAA